MLNGLGGDKEDGSHSFSGFNCDILTEPRVPISSDVRDSVYYIGEGSYKRQDGKEAKDQEELLSDVRELLYDMGRDDVNQSLSDEDLCYVMAFYGKKEEGGVVVNGENIKQFGMDSEC